MKKKFLFLMALLAVSLLALAEMTIYVYHKDGKKSTYIASKIDSISMVDAPHEYVDLGLSVKWATCNVGAHSPEEYGDYFSWGEISPKCSYLKTHYNTLSPEPEVLPLASDAANANWGGAWRMPTKEEAYELINPDNCTWTEINVNGINGYKITSKKNGNSIFLPKCGLIDERGTVNVNITAWYNLASKRTRLVLPNSVVTYKSDLYEGSSIRPVHP